MQQGLYSVNTSGAIPEKKKRFSFEFIQDLQNIDKQYEDKKYSNESIERGK